MSERSINLRLWIWFFGTRFVRPPVERISVRNQRAIDPFTILEVNAPPFKSMRNVGGWLDNGTHAPRVVGDFRVRMGPSIFDRSILGKAGTKPFGVI